MNQGDRCPCCFDTEHENSPLHDIIRIQNVDFTASGIPYMAQYYLCPVLNEIYEDEELMMLNMQSMIDAAEKVN